MHNNAAINGVFSGRQKKPIFLLEATLIIPQVLVKPTVEEMQEVLTIAGKHITNISKGVAQWNSGKEQKVTIS